MIDSWKKWEKKGDLHLINRIQWDDNELGGLREVFDADWFGYGKFNTELEENLARYTAVPYFNLANSGSTAIMTALKVLMHDNRLKRGDLVLHPVTTFPTSISSAIDYGLVPVFVDTKENAYVIDEGQVERAIREHPEIKGMIVPHLLGNIPDMDRIAKALDGRTLIEDCCDTMGGYFDGKHVGSFGDFAAFSFYGSHHITAGGVGGAIGTKNKRFSKLAKSIIFWGHDYDVEQTFLNRYESATIGSDFQMSALQARFALSQMKRLPEFVEARKKQFKEMSELFGQYNFFHLPQTTSHKADPSWFCYPLRIKDDAPFTRENFVYYLKNNNVEIRPIMCGNILRQKPFQTIDRVVLNDGKFPVGDQVMSNGLFIPCWGMPDNQREDYHRILKEFLDSQH